MTKKKLFVIFSSETTLILIHLSHGKRFDTKRPVFKVSHSARGGGLTPNETLSHSNGKFVFDHGPYLAKFTTFLETSLFDAATNIFFGFYPMFEILSPSEAELV